jgi:type II secretory pathway pseudopilin PulG
MEKNKTGKYLKYAIGEIVLVVIGILIALSINNWNERSKENATAKELAQSLIQDLTKDVEFLSSATEFSELKIKECDELFSILKTPIETWDNELFYEKINVIGQSNPFFPTNGTYQQLVTTGSLKYFDQTISNELNAYNMNNEQVRYWSDAEDKTLWLMANILWKGINVQALGEIRFDSQTKNPKYIRIKDDSIDEFTNYVAGVKTYRTKTRIEYKEQLTLAKKIISLLKSEYEII